MIQLFMSRSGSSVIVPLRFPASQSAIRMRHPDWQIYHSCTDTEVNTMKQNVKVNTPIHIRPASPEEAGLFYSELEEAADKKLGTMATTKKKQQEATTPQVEARIDRLMDGDFKTKAFASATIGGAFAVHGIRVIESDKGRFISMPQDSYKKNGETKYNDTFHAITAEARNALVDAVNDAYEQKLQEQQEQKGDAPDQAMSQQM